VTGRRADGGHEASRSSLSGTIAAGGTIDAFIDGVYNYPTLSDSYKYAAYDGLGNLRTWRVYAA
jgi:hypothetical protein